MLKPINSSRKPFYEKSINEIKKQLKEKKNSREKQWNDLLPKSNTPSITLNIIIDSLSKCLEVFLQMEGCFGNYIHIYQGQLIPLSEKKGAIANIISQTNIKEMEKRLLVYLNDNQCKSLISEYKQLIKILRSIINNWVQDIYKIDFYLIDKAQCPEQLNSFIKTAKELIECSNIEYKDFNPQKAINIPLYNAKIQLYNKTINPKVEEIINKAKELKLL